MRDRIPDVGMISYEGLPHKICDSVPDRCAGDEVPGEALRQTVVV